MNKILLLTLSLMPVIAGANDLFTNAEVVILPPLTIIAPPSTTVPSQLATPDRRQVSGAVVNDLDQIENGLNERSQEDSD